jgi:cell shape-determining protein MreD
MILVVLLLGWLAVIGQMALPQISWLVGAPPALLALVVIYGALELPGLWVFFITALLGFYVDLLSPNRLGTSVISLSLLAGLILTQRPTRIVGRLDYRLLLVMVGTFLYLCVDYCFHMLQVGRYNWPFGLWSVMALSAVLNACLALCFFPLLNLLGQMTGWRRREQASRYAG